MLIQTLPRILLLLGALLLLAPLPPAWSLPVCTSGTVSSYLGNPCTIDDKEFAVVLWSGTPKENIAVTPIPTLGNPGLRFSSPDWVNFAGTLDTSIGYIVTVLPGGGLIEDATLTLAVEAGPAGPGVAPAIDGIELAVDKLLCLGGGSCPGGLLDLNASSNGSVHTTFAPVGIIDVRDFIHLSNFDSTSVSLTSVENDFSEVPEPSTLLLLGSGLAGVCGLGWRRWKS